MLNILDDEAVEVVGKEIARWPNKPGLIAIDTFGSATATGDEVKDMPRAMTNARRLSILTGAAVLLNHHPDKTGKWERGGGQFRNRLDLLIEIETVPNAPSFRQLTFHKVRDDKQPETMLIEYCEQVAHTPWGAKTTLVVEGPRTMMDLPMEAIGFLEKVIVSSMIASRREQQSGSNCTTRSMPPPPTCARERVPISTGQLSTRPSIMWSRAARSSTRPRPAQRASNAPKAPCTDERKYNLQPGKRSRRISRSVPGRLVGMSRYLKIPPHYRPIYRPRISR
jgi:hypothetical protein